MTEIKRIEDDFYVASQMTRAGLEEAAALGIRLIINNRPDGEEAGQPQAADIAAWAEEMGLSYRDVPVPKSGPTQESLVGFLETTVGAEGPILAFCRTGTRSCMLWALGSAIVGQPDIDTIVRAAGAAGHDLAKMRPLLEQLSQQNS